MSKKRIVDSEILVRLIEVELVNQYRRFLTKHMVQSPKNCRFNAIEISQDGLNRICRCTLANGTALDLQSKVAEVTGKPCNTLSHAKRCPIFQHYTGVAPSEVTRALTEDFIARLQDPDKRAASFKTLHTLVLVLYEHDKISLSIPSQFKLWLVYHFMQRKYLRYLLTLKNPASKTWASVVSNFKLALQSTQEV